MIRRIGVIVFAAYLLGAGVLMWWAGGVGR